MTDRKRGPRVVLQGFGPDHEIAENTSQLIVEELAERAGAALGLVPVIWPNSTAVVREEVPRILSEHAPDLWLGLGLARGRPALSIERIARNILDFPYPDADGYVADAEPVVPGGAEQLQSDIDVDGILARWREHRVPGYASEDAGGFLCNGSLYVALSTARALDLNTRVGFIHVPPAPAQVERPESEPSMDFDLQVRAVELAIGAALAG